MISHAHTHVQKKRKKQKNPAIYHDGTDLDWGSTGLGILDLGGSRFAARALIICVADDDVEDDDDQGFYHLLSRTERF